MASEGPKFELAIGSRVYIKGAESEGIVTGIMMEQDGMSYRVVYWADGVRRLDWVYGFELGNAVTV